MESNIPPAPEEQGLRFSNSNQIDPLKRQCSIVTLQSEKLGHFAKLIEHLRNFTGNYVNVLLQISKIDAKDALAMVKFVCYVEGMAFFVPKPFFKSKNMEEAKAARENGNEMFKKGQIEKAFRYYSAAVIKANYPEDAEQKGLPDDSVAMLSFSLANRSACLYRMKMYQEAINDIQIALSLNYPRGSKHKLYERLARCHLALKQGDKAKVALTILKQLVNNEETKTMESIESLLKEVALLDQPKISEKNPKEQSLSSEQLEFNVDLKGGQNEKFPEFNEKIQVLKDNVAGRYIVANEDIKPFETVLSEDAFAAILHAEKHGTNCSHCLKRLKAAIGCKQCANIAFCSIECRDEAQDTYHQWECQHQDVITGLGCSAIARLALRMIAIRPLSFFLDRKDIILSKDFENATDEGEYNEDKYLQLLNLVGLHEQRWPEDLLTRSAMALVLLGILRASGYFGIAKTSTSADTYTNNELFIGSLLLKHLQILQFNAHEVHEVIRGSSTSLKPSKNVPIALAIYPTASLINHSCHGSVTRCFQGSRMVLKALRPIKSSSEVCDNYGPTFYMKPRLERRRELSARYWFECQCLACSKNWQLLDALPKDPGFKDEKVDGFMAKGDVSSALNSLIPKLCETNALQEPTEEFIRLEDKLRTCINNFGSIILPNNK